MVSRILLCFRSYKQDAGGNLSLTDFSIQRARKMKQIRKNLVDTVEKMKEPHPPNRKEATALALNSVYRKNLVKKFTPLDAFVLCHCTN